MEATTQLLRKGKFDLLTCCRYTTSTEEQARELFEFLWKEGYRSREDASNAGEVHYYLGGFCKHNHKAVRYVKNGICVTCHQERVKKYNEANKLAAANLVQVKYKIKPEWRKAFDDLAESLRIADQLSK